MQPKPLMEFLQWNPPPLKEIIGKGILYEGGKIIIYGKYKTFKSMLAKSIALSIAYGIDFQRDIPIYKDGASVLYVQSEISEPLLHGRMKPMWENIKDRPVALKKPLWVATEPFLILDWASGYEELRQSIEDLRPEVVILDPVYKFMSGSITDPNAVGTFVRNLDRLCADYNCALILIHHTRKPPVGQLHEASGGSDDMVGAQTFSSWADTVLKIQPKGGDLTDSNIILKADVARHAKEEIPNIELWFDRHTLQFRDMTVHI